MPRLLFTGREAHRLGTSNEAAVACSFEWQEDPWIIEIEYASFEDDQRGIDCWVRTRVGDVPLQVKSGRKRARKHERLHPEVPVVVVYPEDSEETIRRGVKKICRRYLKQTHGVRFGPDGNPVAEEPANGTVS